MNRIRGHRPASTPTLFFPCLVEASRCVTASAWSRRLRDVVHRHGRLAAAPEPEQRAGEPVWFDSVRRVEGVPFLEDLEREVVEDVGEPLGDLAVLVRVAETAEREVDGPFEGAQGLAVERV